MAGGVEQRQSIDRDGVLTILYSAMDELNGTLPEEQRLEKKLAQPLFGPDGRLDSLGLVNLVVALEQHLFEALGREVVIASEAAMSRRHSPFRSVEALADYAFEVIRAGEDSSGG